MSKKRKANKRRNQARQVRVYGSDRHHLLFQARHWDKGCAKALREHFVYMLDVQVHRELHNAIIHDIPKPSEAETAELWKRYQQQKAWIDQMDILQACKWLGDNSNDPAFKACMERQESYLSAALKSKAEQNILRPHG